MASDEQIRLNVVEVTSLDRTSSETEITDKVEEPPDIRGDRLNILFLVVLYVMQSLPYGLVTTIPMILQKRGASYSTQAKFAMDMKLLWAPIVDSCFTSKFGSRKSLLVPIHYLVGFVMITMSFYIDGWIYVALYQCWLFNWVLLMLCLTGFVGIRCIL